MRWAAVVQALIMGPATMAAQEPPPAIASVRLEIDNDLLALRGSGPPADHDYTHGTRISFTRPIPTAPHRARLLSTFALGQEIYTPRLDSIDPVAGERPFAAVLYGAVELQRLAGTTLQTIEVRAGVTGSPALGEAVQNMERR